MKNLISKTIRKYFLVKEILSQKGELHFRRYRLLDANLFKICIHQICRSDADNDPHDHPFDFTSLILKGSYTEMVLTPPNWDKPEHHTYSAGNIVSHKAEDAHKLSLNSKEVWTLVFMSKKLRNWGYRLKSNKWMDHKSYRKLKNGFIL